NNHLNPETTASQKGLQRRQSSRFAGLWDASKLDDDRLSRAGAKLKRSLFRPDLQWRLRHALPRLRSQSLVDSKRARHASPAPHPPRLMLPLLLNPRPFDSLVQYLHKLFDPASDVSFRLVLLEIE